MVMDDLRDPWLGPDANRVDLDRALTRRQQQVLALYAEGRTQGQIAIRLRLARTTVHDHCRAIRRRLDVGSMRDAVAVARTRQLL